MTIEETLFEFETKYPFLYEIEVNGVPVYTCFRDDLFSILSGSNQREKTKIQEEKGRIYPKRILDSFIKLYRFRKANTLVFTSTIFRRDYGRNLAAEYLTEKYPNTVIFEWPSRTDAYDRAYFNDEHKEKYCPLDFYIVFYKVYSLLCKEKQARLEKQCRKRLKKAFDEAPVYESKIEKKAVDFIITHVPESYATTVISQQVFRKLFSKYKNIKYAVDFWGSARENIIPVLPGKFESIELQHGIITGDHPGYLYPQGANHLCKSFFDRTLLVYGETTKQFLAKKSVFKEEQMEVIGNPRILMYKRNFGIKSENRNLILFTSQPFEQDGTAVNYYRTIIPILKEIENNIPEDSFSLGVKLHPRENNGIMKLYKESLPKCEVFDNTSQLFDLLCKTYLHITVSSTTLYEAALFGCPTVRLEFDKRDSVRVYGFRTWCVSTIDEVKQMMKQCYDREQYDNYLKYLIKETMRYM